ncbi:nucleoside phosphorylase domain-containing protein [Pseudomassariella vexata]|uniref:Nucleoside phosphorylase domain-containing protein n=1 Tax=Pseudomassariella vexata TaxID=1141098 RepID=A0A1Y2E3S0_9PEZI|nr:nucleoside phosphorylase domain-containing protein [Pseudomassariella vexata]ORY66203.1 nucleoside phosphorylase domain-containing protein [Pseudomassariella vexata]
MPTLLPEDYNVAWIAPLEIEARAAIHMLDHKHSGHFPMSRGDEYVFEAGDIQGHNVIIATLPAGQPYGTGSAAALASQIKKFFPNLWFGLLVGVAAGLPDLGRKPPRDIRFGDVLVGLPDMDSSGLVAYDLGRETETDGLVLLRQGHILAQTEPVVRSAIGSIKLRSPNETELFLPYFEDMKNEEHSDGTFTDPGQENDRLYEVGDDGIECLMKRAQRPASKRTRVWYGSIGSGEKLMKNATKRNQLRDKHNLIGLEMEAAGTMNHIPVGVIRGVCDYADDHKNWDWQPYAAAMAAAYAKALLYKIPARSKPTSSVTSSMDRDSIPRGRRSTKRSPEPTGDNDEDTSRRKKPRGSEGSNRNSSSRSSNSFRGQGNQNVGSGSISIGGGQHFHQS